MSIHKAWEKIKRLVRRTKLESIAAVAASSPADRRALARAVEKARMNSRPDDPFKPYRYEIKPPELMPGVLPQGMEKAKIAMDDAPYSYARSLVASGAYAGVVGFPGYPYLAMLSTRAEYRMIAKALATSLTREWIVLNSTDTAGDGTKQKITELTKAIEEIGLRDAIRLAAEQDAYYGRAQIVLDIPEHDQTLPLVLSDKTIRKGTKFRIKCIEAMWTTPSAYNAVNPVAPDFYRPSKWFILGKEIHASRLVTIITRPVLDMLKPAFNFGGMSMSQLAEPYVDNWLRTRQSVSDLINNFSIVALQTSMDQVLQGVDDGENLFKRAELFTLTRSNKGLMLLDKDREDLVMLNVPISGLDALQAQSQEQMCSVSTIPAVILLGVAPTGFGNVAEGEIRAFYDRVAAEQEAFWREPIETVVNILQLVTYGSIDPDIVVSFQPLYQMTPKELAEIRTADAQTDGAYVDRGVLSALEVREKLARNPESGYQGIDVDDLPETGEDDEESEGGEQAQGEEDEDVP